jgi:hypothetical protein
MLFITLGDGPISLSPGPVKRSIDRANHALEPTPLVPARDRTCTPSLTLRPDQADVTPIEPIDPARPRPLMT